MNLVIKVNKLTDYATLVLSHLAQAPERQFSATDMAKALNVGKPTISKILKILQNHHIVRSQRGIAGGTNWRATHAALAWSKS